jgi:uncharacterized protein YjbJ (UPF0337 family)
MNADTLKGRWKQVLGRAKQAWSQITNDELLGAQGEMQRISGLLQERCGIVRDQAQKLLNEIGSAATSRSSSAGLQ